MSRYLGLLCLGILTMACSQTGSASADLGTVPDSGEAQDLAMMDAAPVGTMTTLSVLAGVLGGSGTADGIGAVARFSVPHGVAADGAGNLYVTESNSNTIRKVEVATGAVTTLAGSPGLGGRVDGTGATARFNSPQGVAADNAGNVFVADTFNHTIRKVVVATGAVTTLAGSSVGSADGTGAAAGFFDPTGVAVDGAGNLYVADKDNHTIRKVVVATGEVTTLAGSPRMSGTADGTGATARFYSPEGVAVDGAGNLFVADYYTIRKVVVTTGEVTTLAGAGGMTGNVDGTGAAARFGEIYAVAADGAGNLFVADKLHYTIRKVEVATGAVTTVAGSDVFGSNTDGTGTAARFNSPHGVASDGAGNLFISDERNYTIRKMVLATGAVTTLAGAAITFGTADGSGAAARFNGLQGVVADGAGNLLVGDSGSCTIRKVAVATGVVTTVAGKPGMSGLMDGTGTAALFHSPLGLAVDGAGNLLVSDDGNEAIRKVELATDVVTTVKVTDYGTGAASDLGLPLGVAIDGAGNLYFADAYHLTIRKVVLGTSVVTTLAGSPRMAGSTDGTGAAARFNKPYGVAADGAGNLYVSDSQDHTIRKVVVATAEVTTLAGTHGLAGGTDGPGSGALFSAPQGVALDGAGNLYVADSGNSTIRKIQLAGAIVSTVVGVAGQGGVKPGQLPARLNRPTAVAVLPGAGLAIVDENSLLLAR